MAVVRKKQDDKNLKILRELVTSGGGGNRQCFDCGQKGPTYVNMTIGSFVCTRCSGVLRGLTPPHRVKSISMATFTQEEIDFLKANGNEVCAKTWLGLWDPKRIIHQDQRELMIDKYERKRYYLEPASPLKSLTNAATKVTTSNMNGSNNIINNNNNIINNNNNNNTMNGNSNKNTMDNNNLKNISLTPPSSLRLSNNGSSVNGSSTTSTTSNRQQNRYNFQNQFTPEENNFFDTSQTTERKPTSNMANGFLINGGTNGSRLTNVNNNKNSLNITTNMDNSNKFTPDSDFVADFSNANIFNATPAINIPPPMNGYKSHKQQNGIKNNLNHNNTQKNNNNFFNNNNGGLTPSSSSSSSSVTTVTSSDQSNANENFADFDHAPIYNAAVTQQLNNTNNNNFNCFNSSSTTMSHTTNFGSNINNNIISNNNISSNNNNQTVQTFNNFNQSNSNPLQWNIWQQFNWPSSSPTTNISDDQHRWSLPMSLNSASSLSSSTTFNSNSSFNSTPPADRYAALKDLDEQFRENKVTAVDTFSTQVVTATAPSSINPFKASLNQPTPQQQQQQQQQQQIGNPFQGGFGQTATNSFFATPAAQTLTPSSNLFGSSPAINSQMTVGSNFTNGYTMGSASTMNGTTNGINNSNGCGFGFLGQATVNGGNNITSQKNPFTTTSLNSNNPFL